MSHWHRHLLWFLMVVHLLISCNYKSWITNSNTDNFWILKFHNVMPMLNLIRKVTVSGKNCCHSLCWLLIYRWSDFHFDPGQHISFCLLESCWAGANLRKLGYFLFITLSTTTKELERESNFFPFFMRNVRENVVMSRDPF